MSGPAMCPICRHSQRASIDEHLHAGRDLRTLADEFGVRTTWLRHHREEHVAGLTRGRRSAARVAATSGHDHGPQARDHPYALLQ
jgi:hypothetical protein